MFSFLNFNRRTAIQVQKVLSSLPLRREWVEIEPNIGITIVLQHRKVWIYSRQFKLWRNVEMPSIDVNYPNELVQVWPLHLRNNGVVDVLKNLLHYFEKPHCPFQLVHNSFP